jgi:hypothetical protein
LLWLNQIYYWRFKYKIYKSYNYEQLIFNHELLTKDLLKCQAERLGLVYQESTNKMMCIAKVSNFVWELLIKSWKCFMSANICNQSNSIHDSKKQ